VATSPHISHIYIYICIYICHIHICVSPCLEGLDAEIRSGERWE